MTSESRIPVRDGSWLRRRRVLWAVIALGALATATISTAMRWHWMMLELENLGFSWKTANIIVAVPSAALRDGPGSSALLGVIVIVAMRMSRIRMGKWCYLAVIGWCVIIDPCMRSLFVYLHRSSTAFVVFDGFLADLGFAWRAIAYELPFIILLALVTRSWIVVGMTIAFLLGLGVKREWLPQSNAGPIVYAWWSLYPAIWHFAFTMLIMRWSLRWRDQINPDDTCRKCGYNLSGAPHERCPECGRALQVMMRIVAQLAGAWRAIAFAAHRKLCCVLPC